MMETNTPEGTDGFPKAYIRLRTVLDALEMNSLYYVLKPTKQDNKLRIARAKEATALLEECYKQIHGLIPKGELQSCPPGYHDCDGMCVPYNCPLISGV